MFHLLLGLFGLQIISANELPNRSVTKDPNTILILWGTRHGNRHPEKFLDENPRTWGFEGSTELTAFGKRQAYGLGRELRKFVGDFISPNYNRTEVKYYSSSASRCQMTLQTALASLHQPTGWGDWDSRLDWSPIPYSIDDVMLRMYAFDDCPQNKNVWQPIDDDSLSSLASLRENNSLVLSYLQNQTGWNMTSLSKAADLADNLIEMDLYNASYPSWLQNPTLPGYDEGRMKKEILQFAEVHQIACADYAPCGDLMAGKWLDEILARIDDANGTDSPKMVGYASHTEVTLSAMKLMGVVKDELTTSAGFVIEYREVPWHSVRILLHDPNPIDQHVIYRAVYIADLQRGADDDGFIPLADFVEFVKPKAISDWKSACGQSQCSVSRDVTRRPTKTSGSTNVVWITLAIATFSSIMA